MAAKQFILYMITGPTGKKYIGITSTSLRIRWQEHLSDVRCGSKLYLHCAIRKHGAELFSCVEISRADSWEALCDKEKEAILSHKTFAPAGYNLTRGGEGASGTTRSPEWRAYMSSKLKGRKFSPESIAKMSASRKISHARPEVRAKLSAQNRGRAVPDEVRARTSATLKGLKRFNTNNKLFPEDVIRIREQALFGAKRKDTSKAFGVGLPNICLILNRRAWNNLL